MKQGESHKSGLDYCLKRFNRLNVAGGYVIPRDSVFHLYVPDYQGNNVAVINTATGQAEQLTDYYPYGQPINNGLGASVNPYKYGGKELLTANGYNASDFAARWLSHSLPGFQSPDPLAHETPWLSMYMYCGGDPINLIDPTGCYGIGSENWGCSIADWYGGLDLKYNVTNSFFGTLKVAGGLIEAAAGATAIGTGVGATVGWIGVIHGLDTAVAGIHQLFTGQDTSTLLEQSLAASGVSPNLSAGIDIFIGLRVDAAVAKTLTTTVSLTSKADDIRQEVEITTQLTDEFVSANNFEYVTQRLQEITTEAGKIFDGPSSMKRGNAIHQYVEQQTKSLNVGSFTLEIEKSFLGGQATYRGCRGSSRPDILIRDSKGSIFMIWDIKSGAAKLGTKQMEKYKMNLPDGVIIHELHTP